MSAYLKRSYGIILVWAFLAAMAATCASAVVQAEAMRPMGVVQEQQSCSGQLCTNVDRYCPAPCRCLIGVNGENGECATL